MESRDMKGGVKMGNIYVKQICGFVGKLVLLGLLLAAVSRISWSLGYLDGALSGMDTYRQWVAIEGADTAERQYTAWLEELSSNWQ